MRIDALDPEQFRAAEPFPHVIVDDFVDAELLAAVDREIDQVSEGWTHYHHVNEKKRGLSDRSRMGRATRTLIDELSTPELLRALERLSGIQGLLADPDLDGGGLHETFPGGFLNVHTDFLSHTKRASWSRRLNLLLFMSRDWEDSHQGWLELWDADVSRAVQRIPPLFNRCVIFETSARSFHGVPSGVACPPGSSRRSLALYYFRDEGRPLPLRPTHYVPLPGATRLERALIRLDRWALHAYSLLKRHTPLGDRLVSRILRHF